MQVGYKAGVNMERERANRVVCKSTTSAASQTKGLIKKDRKGRKNTESSMYGVFVHFPVFLEGFVKRLSERRSDKENVRGSEKSNVNNISGSKASRVEGRNIHSEQTSNALRQ